jgi:CTP synthase (UTP-ammonia lyase)
MVIALVACPVADRREDAPRLSGRCGVRMKPDSRLARIYGATRATEEYFCNYEVNRAYHERLAAAGLLPVAFGEQGEWRAVELPRHRFFVATLFQPQLSSREGAAHPLFKAFLAAAVNRPQEAD